MKRIIDVPEEGINACQLWIEMGVASWQDKVIANSIPYVEPKQGEWVKIGEGKTRFFCSECGREIDTKPFTRPDNFPFCHCGAKMKGGAEE